MFDIGVGTVFNASNPQPLLLQKAVCSLGGVRSHHLVLRLGVDAHHARVAIGDSLVIRVFMEKG